jgi:hypothetical protein
MPRAGPCEAAEARIDSLEAQLKAATGKRPPRVTVQPRAEEFMRLAHSRFGSKLGWQKKTREACGNVDKHVFAQWLAGTKPIPEEAWLRLQALPPFRRAA